MSATLLRSAARHLNRVGDALLTTQTAQRLRLAQAGLAMLLMSAGVLAMHYFVWAGTANAGAVWLWTAAALGGMSIFFGLIRSGWSRRFADPALTFPQMFYALACGAAAYALVGAGRGGVFPMVMATLMFGMFQLQQRQAVWISVYAVLLFGGVMSTMASLDPQNYPPLVELGHFLLVAIMMPAVSIMAGRLSQMRQRLRDQKRDLAQALARIQELATRDGLTGLSNRRHMLDLIKQERQRCERSGRRFCLALIDIDHFKSINDGHGHGVGDAVLRALAQEMRSVQRATDALARWGGEEFVLLLTDTHLLPAIGGVERLRERVQGLALAVATPALQVTVSCGAAEYQAGETVDQTLERADLALYQAKAQGRNRSVVAPECAPSLNAPGAAATAPTAAAAASCVRPALAPPDPNPRSSPLARHL